MKRPNILYLHSHDTGRYASPYGHAIDTPNIQRLAEEGILFRQVYCAAPTCSPSRAALLTGHSPHSAGMTGLAHRGWRLNDYGQHLVHTLKAAGYTTALSGIQHVASDPNLIGYDRVLTSNPRRAASHALEFLNAAPTEPFFLSVGFFETHREFPEPDEDDPRYVRPPAPLPDTPAIRRDIASYQTMASQLDAKIGAILNALDRNGLRENTLVICTTDHGPAFPAMKCNLTDHGIGVMLIMRGPDGFTGGHVVDSLISQIDLFPTLCDVLEIDPPTWLQGRSFLPIVRDEVDEVNEAIFAEVSWHAAYEPKRAVRTKRWKYIRRFGDRTKPVLPNCDDSPSKDEWMAHGWADRSIPQEQLYDLIFDPNETHNLAGQDSTDSVLHEMRRRLDEWMAATSDPLLEGPVPLPPGARYNPADGVSPREAPLTAPE